ncbi:MAG: PqqD family peptide modification chaperone [Lachnospiraceae bacterium]|nr:PqqD family peptide modification chaperone [Lachnospiraceae bacterium]MDD3616698.1 PqqD family peptide modification chaperone [Lachnospiraceae bacterium]
MMDKATKIKMKKQLNVTDLSGEKVMIDFDSGKYFMIKGSGNDIWDMIQEETTVGDIIDGLLKIYDVSEKECTDSVLQFLQRMISNCTCL